MSKVKLQLRDIDAENLQNITEKAIALRDLFGYDVSESVRSVKTMMDNFNISADEAFNLIAEGKKQGLDFSNEMLDNVNEYSVQFKKLGLTAEDMFNIFKIGADNGAFNLDKIGDAVKEFSIRSIDGSNTTIDGFKRIGLNAEEMSKKIASGGDEAKKVFVEVVKRLGSMDDKVSQSAAGVDLFGTTWEDLGPQVITSFSNMDNGIKQNSNSMQNSIDELYSTTKKKAEMQLKRLQSLGADFGKEMLPILEKLIDKTEDFVSSLSEMSDEEKQNIVKIGLMVAAAGPLAKILGTTANITGTAAKGIGMFSQAVAVATNKTTSTSGAVNKLATGMQSTAGKASMVVGGTAAIIGGLMALDDQINKSTQTSLKNTDEYIQSITNEVNARQNAIDARKQQLDANVAEIDNISKLKGELTTLVDANGKVKDGYEIRAKFILGELNNALGTEYNMTGNVIRGYNDLSKTLDEVILKKRAEVILEGNAEAYKEAIKNKNKLYEEYLKTQDEILKKKSEIKKIEEQPYLFEASRLEDLNKAEKQYQELTEKLKTQSSQIKQYNSDIVTYEKNSELMIKGGVENYKKIEQSYTSVGLTSVNVNKNTIDKKLADTQRYVDESKKKYNIDVQNGINANESKYREEVESGNRSISELANQLVGMTSTVDALSPELVNAWVLLAQNSREQYNSTIAQLPPDMQNKISQIVGVVQADTSVQEAMKAFSESALNQTKIDNKFEEAGKNWLRGVNRGINNKLIRQEALSSMYGFGVEGLKAISEQAWGEQSPSKETEKASINLLKGVNVGLKKETPNTLREIRKAADNILKNFDINSFGNLNPSALPHKLSNIIDAKTSNKNLVQNITINTNRKIDDLEIKNITQKISYEMGKFF